MKGSTRHVVVFGYSSLDYSMRVREFQEVGNTTLVQHRLSPTWPEAGGIARFFPGLVGDFETSAISWVGSDALSQEWIREIERLGGQIFAITALPGTAPTAYLFHDSVGASTCFFAPGILDPSRQTLSTTQSHLLKNASHVIAAVAPEAATRELLDILESTTKLIWIVKSDRESLPVKIRTRLFERANLIIYSHQELTFLQEIPLIGSKDPLDAKFIDKLIIRTSGKSNVECAHNGIRSSYAVAPVEGEINATGAGDFFAGQFVGSYISTLNLSDSVNSAISKTSVFLINRSHEKVGTQ